MARSELALEWESSIGPQVRKLRLAKGLSQEELAQKAGTTRNTIATIENDGREPRYWTAWRIAQVLEVKMEQLAGQHPKAERVVVEAFPRRGSSRSTLPGSRRLQAQAKPGDNTATRTLPNSPVVLRLCTIDPAPSGLSRTPTTHDLTQVGRRAA